MYASNSFSLNYLRCMHVFIIKSQLVYSKMPFINQSVSLQCQLKYLFMMIYIYLLFTGVLDILFSLHMCPNRTITSLYKLYIQYSSAKISKLSNYLRINHVIILSCHLNQFRSSISIRQTINCEFIIKMTYSPRTL